MDQKDWRTNPWNVSNATVCIEKEKEMNNVLPFHQYWKDYLGANIEYCKTNVKFDKIKKPTKEKKNQKIRKYTRESPISK